MEESLTILDQLKIASLSEVLLVAILLLPFYLGFWSFLVKEISLNQTYKRRFYLIASLFYFIAIAVLKYGDFRQEKYTTAEIAIKSHLRNEQWEIIGFNRIRSNINKNYKDDFLEKLISITPEFSKIYIANDSTEIYGIKYIYDSENLNFFDAALRIKKSMQRDSFERIGFNRIRQNIDSRYSDEFLEELCERNQELFERIPLKDSLDSRGLKLLK
ncbi:hypothetical protein [Reichenbachiella sp.]|uniref:hypothetical protein n=1 Tax=Reichenbachiella sp. TaxID=2184521 RepID=UPI0032979D29